mgnify:CR=1 FL=1
MELKPIRKNITLKDQAYEQIRQAINTNTLKPGTSLTEEQLSSMLSISRTPIRSALQQLVYEKLLSQDATGHIYVSTITEKSVQDTSKVRTVLECMAIDSAVFPLSEAKLQELERIDREQHELIVKHPEDLSLIHISETTRIISDLQSWTRNFTVQLLRAVTMLP